MLVFFQDFTRGIHSPTRTTCRNHGVTAELTCPSRSKAQRAGEPLLHDEASEGPPFLTGEVYKSSDDERIHTGKEIKEVLS